MQSTSILLVNSNRVKPPVSPVGLEYVAGALAEAEVTFKIVDLALADYWKSAISKTFENYEPLAIAVSVRNSDDCSFVTRKSYLPWIKELVNEIRRYTKSPVVLGGGGFSVMPEVVLDYTNTDAGIIGDGEETMIRLAKRLSNAQDFRDLPNLVFRKGNVVGKNKISYSELTSIPGSRRRTFDNSKYQELGAMVGVETKRGCPNRCVYCADPIIKGNKVRIRPPEMVIAEFKDLLAQGVSWFHLCDSEFNIPINHAKSVCRAIIENGISEKINWYCYCSPVPFDKELASLMRKAGCKGINFGTDSLCSEQLLRLGREYNLESVKTLVDILKEAGLNYIFDLLIGGPGETESSISESISAVKYLDVPSCGISIGVRVYPGTLLEKSLSNGFAQNGLRISGATKPYDPAFFVSPYLENEAFEITRNAIDGDSRFMLLANPSERGSYNYADDDYLSEKIKSGERGAYWDILKRNNEESQR